MFYAYEGDGAGVCVESLRFSFFNRCPARAFYVSYAFVPWVIKTFWPESTDGGPLRFKRARKFILLPHLHRAVPCGDRGKVRVCHNGERRRISPSDELRFACHVFAPWTLTEVRGKLVLFVWRACEPRRENASLWFADDRYDLLTYDYVSARIHVVYKGSFCAHVYICICARACVRACVCTCAVRQCVWQKYL